MRTIATATLRRILGEVLWQLGQQDEARAIWSEASAVDADNHLLKATRHRLHFRKP